jgi:uncharacterized protein (DUF2132 family)
MADPDLEYLNIADERESVEKEYLKQDSEHMEALEAAYARLQEQNRTMEQQLKVRTPRAAAREADGPGSAFSQHSRPGMHHAAGIVRRSTPSCSCRVW